ncbi:MAG: electron transfer flavoprotein subunit beta/FixA family protein [Chloroflexi bacterium]|nr:electron transfer flavoprotein subunit beta/FixA family protein [Chloroflexota bacterium]
MNIVACVKQVPDTTAEKRLNSQLRLDRASVENILNPFDEYAVEAALQLKEKHGGQVTVLCMGMASAKDALRKALAMGADKAVLISDAALEGSDAISTSYILAQALKKLEYDLIICGMASTDSATAIVPGAVAEFLGLPQLTYANKLEAGDGKVTINRQTEAGYAVVESSLPALVSVVKGINEPRYPSLKGIMAAKRAEITAWSVGDLGAETASAGAQGARAKILGFSQPEARKKGQVAKDDGSAAITIVEYLTQIKAL